MIFTLISIIFIIAIIVSLLKSGFYVVKQESFVIIERFGKYLGTFGPGFHFRIPVGVDKIATQINMRMQQSEVQIETKTKDNVFVTMNVATQFKVDVDQVKDAYYRLTNPEQQIQAYIEDALRSAVPKLTLDDVFEKKDEIAIEVQKTVSEEMKSYGYIIVKSLITSVEPDQSVKESMNEINAAQRKRDAAQMLANADKIKVVTAAQAEAEKDKLRGIGIADQRKAIVDGLATQISELKATDASLNETEIMAVLLANQYMDTLNQFAEKGNSTIFLPSGPEGANDIKTQILAAIKASK